MKKLKILMLTWELPPFNSGGLGVASYFIAVELNKFSNLTVIVPGEWEFQNLPFKVISLNQKAQLVSYQSGFEVKDEVKKFADSLINFFQNQPFDFDLIYAHDWLTLPAGFFLKEKYQVPLIWHVHATEIDRTGGNPNFGIYQIEKFGAEQVDQIIAVSEYTKKVLIQFYQADPKKIEVVFNGIDLSSPAVEIPQYLSFLKDQGYQIVLFVGRLVLQKGPDYLLEAIPYILEYYPKVKFLFVGTGEMMEELIQRAEEKAVSSAVIFAGFLREEKLWGVYQMADVLVVPSVSDPFGLVVLEGLKFNLPVLVSSTTGVGEQLRSCLKFPFWDVKRLANQIVGVLKYKELKQEMQERGRIEILNFSWQAAGDRLKTIFSQFI